MFSNKGLSPLIALVIVVAITLAISGVIANWSNVFVRERVEDVSDTAGDKIKCQNAAMRIKDGELNTTSQKVTVTAENTGTIQLTDFEFDVLLTNGTSISSSPETSVDLDPERERVMTTSDVIESDADNIDNVRLIGKCESISIRDDLSGSELAEQS